MFEHTPESLLLASLQQGLVAGDRQRQITHINPAAARLLGLDVDQWMGRPIDALCEAYGIPAPEALAEHRQLISANGLRFSAQALRLPDTPARADLGFALALSPEDAERQAMIRFIGTLAHELRTPLTVVRGNSELLLRGLAGPISADLKEIVGSISQGTTTMTSFISNMLVLTDLDLGTLSTDLEPTDMRPLVEEALRPLRRPIEARGLSLTVDLPDDLPPALADFHQTRTALHHLLDNARRFTAAGGIAVRASALADMIQVEVEDSGRGIAPDLLPRIFERFVRDAAPDDAGLDRSSHATHPAMPGFGLGLPICKQLIERQGGRIWVTSAPGQGSRFCLTLPIALQA
jgi:signal transduction histidine kinase